MLGTITRNINITMKKKEQLPAIWVEEKEYSDRSEFRVCVRARYPTGLNRPGVYEHYL